MDKLFCLRGHEVIHKRIWRMVKAQDKGDYLETMEKAKNHIQKPYDT